MGTNSVNSEPRPKSMSRKPYSQVDAAAAAAEANDDAVADDDVSEYVDDDIVDRVVKVVGVLLLFTALLNDDGEDVDTEPPLVLLCTEDAVNVPLIETVVDVSETGTAAGGLVDDVAGGRIVNRSLLLSGSNADCEDRLRTELQLMDRFESSSPYPESLSLDVVVVLIGTTAVAVTGLGLAGKGVARPD